MDPLNNCSLAHRGCPKCPQKPQVIGTLIANPKGDLYKGDWCKTLSCPQCSFFGMYARNADSGKSHFSESKLVCKHSKEHHIANLDGKTYNDKPGEADYYKRQKKKSGSPTQAPRQSSLRKFNKEVVWENVLLSTVKLRVLLMCYFILDQGFVLV
jgi:hypothetical protein